MIRINLLPEPRAKGAKKGWDVRIEVAVALVLVLSVTGACFYYASLLDDEIQAKEQEKQSKDKQILALKEKVKQVEDFEKRKKQLEDKNRIIDQLEKARGGPVKALDFLSQSIEPLKLWMVRLNVKGKDLELEGKALTQDDVVEFFNNLRKTDYFVNIRLLESRSITEPGAAINIYSFKLVASLKG